jgi:hypothetical protein
MPNPAPVMTETQARALRQAESRCGEAEAELAAAKEQRDLLRAKYKPLIPVVEDKADRKKGVREISILGGKIRITPCVSGKTFAIAKYLAAGGRITAKMRPHVGGEAPYDRWTVDLPG